MKKHEMLKRKFPQNYIFKKPLMGSILVALVSLIFVLLYKPLGFSPAQSFDYFSTMVIYAFVTAVSIFISIKIVKKTKFFTSEQWTLPKEILAIFLVLLGMGTAIYLFAFVVEAPIDRWNLPTLLDSFSKAFLVGIIPFAFFTIMNLSYWLGSEKIIYEKGTPQNRVDVKEGKIKITSQLKKEELSFYPKDLIYASSESNYVNFYLWCDEKMKKEVIRNSISNVEQQLSHVPYLIRTHRAFIVNLKKIRLLKGNSMGYRLWFYDVDEEVPVSRNKTREFHKLFKELH